MYFIFVRRAVLFREGGERVREAKTCLEIFAKMRACSFYNGLILCRRHCFTIVAHNWKFWQMYFAWKYCTEVIYVYMYSFMNVFLNPYTRTECNFFVILFAIPSLWRLSRDLARVGSGSPDFYRAVYCMSYSLCVHFKKNSSVVETKHEFCLAKCFFIYWIRHDDFQAEGLLFPSCTD